MEFRKSYPTDAYKIVKIKDDVWKNTYYDILPSRILVQRKENLEDRVNHLKDQIIENNRIIVATEEEKIIGYIFYAKSLLEAFPDSAEIREIAVLPEYQRKGVGLNLFKLAEEEVKKLGYHSFVIQSPTEGTYKNFFQKIGGIIKKSSLKEVADYQLSYDIFYIAFERRDEPKEDWNILFFKAQQKLYLLKETNKEVAVILSSNHHFYFGLGIKDKVHPLEVALSNLYLNDENTIEKILILNKNSKPVLPCGKCLDLLMNLGHKNTEILFDLGTLKTLTIKELMPYYKDEEKV